MSNTLQMAQPPKLKVQSCKGCTGWQIKVTPKVVLWSQKCILSMNVIYSRWVNFCDEYRICSQVLKSIHDLKGGVVHLKIEVIYIILQIFLKSLAWNVRDSRPFTFIGVEIVSLGVVSGWQWWTTLNIWHIPEHSVSSYNIQFERSANLCVAKRKKKLISGPSKNQNLDVQVAGKWAVAFIVFNKLFIFSLFNRLAWLSTKFKRCMLLAKCLPMMW